MNKNFKEVTFHDSFSFILTKQCEELIVSSTSFNLVGLPGVGTSFFLRYLSSKLEYKFIHINTYEMPEFTKNELFDQLNHKLGINRANLSEAALIRSITSQLEKLLNENSRIVLIFNRLDRLESLFDQSFFDNIRCIRDVDREKIVMIFASEKPIYEIASEHLKDSLNLFAKSVFIKPYSIDDLKLLTQIDKSYLLLDRHLYKKALILSGGHHSLCQTLIRCQSLTNPLSDPMVELLIKNIYLSLNILRRENLRKLVLGKKIDPDQFLINIGLLEKFDGNKYRTFSPLLEQFIVSNKKKFLPQKEQKLLNLLRSYQGQVVSKEKIFETIWKHEAAEASDWALNSLIYRLKRNPAFPASTYTIENQKKEGYVLNKIDKGR